MFLSANRWALICLILCSCNATAGEAWEVGATLGYAAKRNGIDSLNQFFRDNSMAALAESRDSSRQAWSLYLNIPLIGHFGAQLGYTDLGSADTIILGVDNVVEPYLTTLDSYPVDTIKGSYLAASYSARLNDMASVQTKAGLYYWNARYAIHSFESSWHASGRGINALAGLALNFQLNRRISATVGWDIYTPDGESFDFLNLGLRYRLR